MAFKLSKTEKEQYEQHARVLAVAKDDLSDSINHYNDTMRDANVRLNEEIARYNSVLKEVRDFCAAVGARGRKELDNMDDQESDDANDGAIWTEEWEEVELDDLEQGVLDEAEYDLSQLDILEGLPEEVD